MLRKKYLLQEKHVSSGLQALIHFGRRHKHGAWSARALCLCRVRETSTKCTPPCVDTAFRRPSCAKKGGDAVRTRREFPQCV